MYWVIMVFQDLQLVQVHLSHLYQKEVHIEASCLGDRTFGGCLIINLG